jgi:hypothetical protein
VRVQPDSKARLQDFLLAAIHAGLIDVFEARRTMAAYRACAIAEGRDPGRVRFRWVVGVEEVGRKG